MSYSNIRIGKEDSGILVIPPSLREIFLKSLPEWKSFCDDVGPCGAVTVALSRLGYGNVARVQTLTYDEQFSNCPSWWDDGTFVYPHYVVVTPDDSILDISLPPDFQLVGYENEADVMPNNLPCEDDDGLWNEEDFSFWKYKFQEGTPFNFFSVTRSFLIVAP